MTTRTNRKQLDKPRWVTPKGAPVLAATESLLSSWPEGTVIATDVVVGDDRARTMPLAFVKVSEAKWAPCQGKGVPASRLVGARIVRRVRRDDTTAVTE